MTETDRSLLSALKWHIWVVAICLAAVLVIAVAAFVLTIRHWDLSDIKAWIRESKCNGGAIQARQQVHEQHVTVSSSLVDPKVLKDELKRRNDERKAEERRNEHLRGLAGPEGAGDERLESGEG